MTNYILRHQNRDVAAFRMDADGDIDQLTILRPADMPILGNGIKNLCEWVRNRAIPDSRADLDAILREAGCGTAQEYMVRNLALSLSDSYWICLEEERDVRWEDVNLYQHPTGLLTFRNGITETSRRIKNNSSLGGSLEKLNLHASDGWHLIKKGDPDIPDGLQNINEAFAAMLHERQGFRSYTGYTLNFDAYGSCESCDCRYFTDAQHELISADNVTGGIAGQAETPKEAYREYIEACVAGGLERKEVVHFMDYMLMTDFLISNTDRHWENFGVLRNPETLEFQSLAPIFDSGTSMMCDDPFTNTRLRLLKRKVHGICYTQQENLELIEDRSVVDLAKLPTTEEVIAFYTERGVQKERALQIAQCFALKKEMLEEFQQGAEISVQKEYEGNQHQ